MALGVIELKGMEFHSFIGHYDEEKQIGNNFKINLRLWYDYSKAAETDKLKYALDYQAVYDVVKREMSKKCNLIENVAQRILDSLFEEFSQIEKLEVQVVKIFPKLGGMVEEVSITVYKER